MNRIFTNPNYKRNLLLLFLFASAAFFFSACNAKKPALGQEDEIFVFADSTEYYNLEASLVTVFSKVIYTPQREALFNLTRKNLNELDKFKDRKNIILIAPLDSKSDVSVFINKILDPKVIQLVKEDSATVINKKDLWAKNQLVMVLTGPNMETLNKNILGRGDDLIHFFQKESDDRLSASLYNSRYEQKKIEAQILKEYNWMMYVQTDYGIAKDDSTEKFVWLRRSPGTDLERWIFVHWVDNASPALLNKDTVIAMRNRMTKKFMRSTDDSSYVKIDDNYLNTKEVNFKNRYSLFTQGLWRMSDGSMGGPFINYTFYDQPSKRLYMLDGAIYAPRYYKKKLIQQVDVLLQSFLTGREVNPDKREDLMEELE